jgi:hypothetical protein
LIFSYIPAAFEGKAARSFRLYADHENFFAACGFPLAVAFYRSFIPAFTKIED